MSMMGKTLGHYKIGDQPLGRGGMGEVYRAKDLKLGRDVAIKILPEEFARDADRVARFQREAKLLASLNHPNIAAIYGLEESGGIQFLVLELVEGETLADQLKRGPIPVEESLKLALQIAEALEAAHEKGIIHRDLKPANIKVTPEGKVKVLDFGLAKAFAGEQADLNLSNSPTLSNAATQQGVILGTAAYMSPEQARGKSVDKRADIWAFGCVLYEMLTGQAAFQGEDITEILAAVVKGGANLDLLPANLHFRVHEVITRCLQKDLKRRYSIITDARYEIEQTLADPSGVLVQPVMVAKSNKRLRVGISWLAAAVVIAAIIAGVVGWKLKPPEPRQVIRFDYDLPEGHQLDLLSGILAVSPDGTRFVYATTTGLYLRSMDQPAPRLILSSDKSPMQPFFSPDGQWVGYFSENQLKKISINGGAPISITTIGGNPVGPSWGADGMIVFGQVTTGKIMRVSANGGTPELLFEIQGKMLFAPRILPDGKSVLVSQYDGREYQIIVQSLKSGQRKTLGAGYVPRYLPTGHIAYMVGNNLFAVPFNVNRLEVAGGAVSMVEGIAFSGGPYPPQYAISDSGTLVYVPATASSSGPGRTLVWVDRKGKEQPIAAQPNDYREPHISPDGTKLALDIVAINYRSEIWIWDLARETMTRLTFNEASRSLLWTPDGKRIAFNTIKPGLSNSAVYWKAADGTGGDEKLGSVPGRLAAPWSWSGDGKILVTQEYIPPTNSDIGSLSMEGDHKWNPLLQEKYNEIHPKISPDGRWMAYASDESGKLEVYVRPFPDVNKGKWQVSTSGGIVPLWSPSGRELFYLNGDSAMAVAVETGQTFKCGKPETLYRGTYTSSSGRNSHIWDISPDGKRFLMMKEVGASTSASEGPRKINIVVNWFEELKQRVPAK